MKAIDLEVKRICEEKLANDAKLSELFKNCYPNTMDTTVKIIGEKDTFVITGDIPPCGCVIPPRRFATICPSQSTTQRLPIALRAS